MGIYYCFGLASLPPPRSDDLCCHTSQLPLLFASGLASSLISSLPGAFGSDGSQWEFITVLAWRPSLLPAAMTSVAISASSRSFLPPGLLLPLSYPCLGRLGVMAPSGNLLLSYLHSDTLVWIHHKAIGAEPGICSKKISLQMPNVIGRHLYLY